VPTRSIAHAGRAAAAGGRPGWRVRPAPARGRRARPLEQLSLGLAAVAPRWSLSRLVLRSAHRARIIERLEFVRRFYPELDHSTVRVGLALKRGVLGWGSLDPERPGVWVRPRRLHYFTIAHEFTHLLQARRLVPRGERACDLWSLARSPLLVDHPPGYLALPRALRAQSRVEGWQSVVLHEAARRAIEARAAGERRYLLRFEREAARALAARR